ncbi:MAG: DNA-binding protein HU-beta [Parasphingorhabdus sp.]
MNKSELVDALANATGGTKADATLALDSVVSIITDAMRAGDTVAITGFGAFSVGDRAARTGRNPQTGEAIDIAAAKIPKFKAGKALKDAVN